MGKEIVTAGGLYGTITAVDGDEVRVEIADGLEVRIAKRAVAGRRSSEDEEDRETRRAETEPKTPATLPR